LDPPIIDIHIHLYRTSEQGHRGKKEYEIWEYGEKDVTLSRFGGSPEEALTAIDEAGAERAVVVNLCSQSSLMEEGKLELPGDIINDQREKAVKEIASNLDKRLKASNEWVCNLARRHPELIPFVGVDPRILGPEEMDAHVRKMAKDRGAKGVKVHPVSQGFHMHDPRMSGVWKACVELDLPVIAHVGPAKSGDQYATPEAFAPVMHAFPELTIVMAHMGGGSWRQLPEFAEAHPSAYYDICEIVEWTGASRAPTDLDLVKLILKVGPEKVMMGSDFPWYSILHTVERVHELPLLTEEQRSLILGGNALEFLA
jgi:predicted TIM-barrel fold metal-dependent hydrolase